jgi:hypothetical protein
LGSRKNGKGRSPQTTAQTVVCVSREDCARKPERLRSDCHR